MYLRMVGVLASLVGGVLLFVGVVAERDLRSRELERLHTSLSERAALVVEMTGGQALDPARIPELDALADRAGRASGARITLIAPDGTVVGDSAVATAAIPALASHASRPEVDRARSGEPGAASRFSESVGRDLLYLALPAGGGPERGFVRVAVPLGEIEARAVALRWRLARAGALGLVLSLVLAGVVSFLTLRPIQEIADVVGAIAEGHLERRLPWRQSGWLADISTSINAVAEQMVARLTHATAEKEQLEAVLASMVEGVMVIQGGRVSLANPRARELLSAWGEIEGRRPLEVVRQPAIESALLEAERTRLPVVRELEIGEAPPRMLLMHAVSFPPEGEPVGTAAVFHDVTEIRRLEQVRRDFIANASHELRTPLTSIRGFADTLLASDLPAEEGRPYLEVIVRNAERLGNLIDDLLALSRIESRKFPLRPSEVDVARLCRTVASDLAPRLEEARLDLKVDVAPVCNAWADRRAVEQVVSNLLENAIRYTDAGGRIDLSARVERGRVWVRVRDTGIGIPEEDRDRIFERFYRVDKARSRALGGTGLGLSIVKHLVQAMGGEITVESEVGSGSCFRFSLPRAGIDDDPGSEVEPVGEGPIHT